MANINLVYTYDSGNYDVYVNIYNWTAVVHITHGTEKVYALYDPISGYLGAFFTMTDDETLVFDMPDGLNNDYHKAIYSTSSGVLSATLETGFSSTITDAS